MVTSTDNFFDTSLQIHHEQVFALYNQIEKLKLTSYPSNEIPIFINDLSSISKLLLDKFKSSSVLNYSEILLYRQTFNSLQKIVSFISQANITYHPTEVMIPAKELILEFGDETLFFTQPLWYLNYAIGDVWIQFASNIKKIFPELQFDSKKKILIQFPIIHKDDVLLGCVMGHELGHYFDLHSGLNISAELLPQLLLHKNLHKLQAFLQFKLQNTQITLSDQQENRLKHDLIKKILGENHLFNWLKEFVADIAGILLYGPASHFSGDSIFTFSSLSEEGHLVDDYSKSHPRSSLRSIVRMATFDKLDYKHNFDSYIQKHIEISEEKWRNSKIHDTTSFIDGHIRNDLIYRLKLNPDSYKLIEDILIDNLPSIIDFVMSKIPSSLHYNASKFKEVVPKLSKKISNFIPPNELNNSPVDSISILNSGWHAYLVHKDTLSAHLSENEQDYNIREVINNLVKKALTSAHIHRRWNHVNFDFSND
ncbi:M48 family metalloprotease [Caryophanon latum]|uniref:Uncharacterized protein n=1 Tax=Caryophanon latum TaxID=33977 RepID=A0A1C0YB58_9BACL|nr:M48 family metalloprotease [Caryophanon latum]OCS84408.1 hypothetical protein A6K76_03195 [Caryophanon latum]